MLGLGNTLSGGIVPAAAVVAFDNTYSLAFDGTNDYVICDPEPYDDGSYAMWFKTSASTPRNIFTKNGDGNWYIYLTSTAVFVRHPMVTYFSATVDVNDGNWHFLVVTADGGSGVESTVKIYVDGSLIDTKVATNTYTVTTDKAIAIGTYNASVFREGNIEEVSVWSSVLALNEIGVLYNGGTPIDLSSNSGNYVSSGNLINWWRMGDGDTYPTITDHTTDGNDGTMTNMAENDIVEDVPSA